MFVGVGELTLPSGFCFLWNRALPWLFLPAFVTAKAFRDGFEVPLGFARSTGFARPLSRLALCGFFLALSCRNRSQCGWAGVKAASLRARPSLRGSLALTQEPCGITLRRLCRREPRKQRDRCRPSERARAPEEAQGGSEEPPQGRRQVAKPPYRQERSDRQSPSGEGGRTMRQASRLALSSPAVVSW
jgi:hypothetical protein